MGVGLSGGSGTRPYAGETPAPLCLAGLSGGSGIRPHTGETPAPLCLAGLSGGSGTRPLRGRAARATERLRVGVGVFVDFF